MKMCDVDLHQIPFSPALSQQELLPHAFSSLHTSAVFVSVVVIVACAAL